MVEAFLIFFFVVVLVCVSVQVILGFVGGKLVVVVVLYGLLDRLADLSLIAVQC